MIEILIRTNVYGQRIKCRLRPTNLVQITIARILDAVHKLAAVFIGPYVFGSTKTFHISNLDGSVRSLSVSVTHWLTSYVPAIIYFVRTMHFCANYFYDFVSAQRKFWYCRWE